MIEKEIYSILSESAAVTEIVDDRVYPIIAPQSADRSLARVVYSIVNEEFVYSHDGYSNLDIDLFQVSCQSISYDTARALARACFGAFNEFEGTEQVSRYVCESSVEFVNNPTDGSDKGMHIVVLTFRVFISPE